MQRKIALFIIESVALGLVVGFVLWYFMPYPGTSTVKSSALTITSYNSAVEKAAPAVVNIYSSKRRNGPVSLGSGVIISPNGYILTNDHLIRGANEIAVALRDGRSDMARVVGRDPETDLAVLSIELRDLPTIKWGDSQQVAVGDVVLAIGNPLGFSHTVTMGIVSGLGRNQVGFSTFENFIQTDAAINPGNSGGALINTSGELIGINTAIASRTGGYEGIAFAVPGDLARGLLKQIIEHGRVSRGWLGVNIQNLNRELAESFGVPAGKGVLISGVWENGPGAKAGLRPGDVILTVNGKEVTNNRAALNSISAIPPGETIELQIIRSGQNMKITATVADRSAALPAN